jgi:molecular chaperone DnaK (HSP70)
VIGYGEGERKLGELGTFKLKSNSKNTIVSPSRYLGLTNASCELVHCPCPARETNAGVTFGVDSNGQHENLVPEQVLAGFMGHLGGIVTLHGLDSKFTMFAVPSFYTEI